MHSAVVRLSGGRGGRSCLGWTDLARGLATGYTCHVAATRDRPQGEDGDDNDGDQERPTGDPPADRRPLLLNLLIVRVAAWSAAEGLLTCLAVGTAGLLSVRTCRTVLLLPVPLGGVVAR